MATPRRESLAAGSDSPPNSVKAFAEARCASPQKSLHQGPRRNASIASGRREPQSPIISPIPLGFGEDGANGATSHHSVPPGRTSTAITTADGDFVGSTHAAEKGGTTSGQTYSLFSSMRGSLAHAAKLSDIFSAAQRDDEFFGLLSQGGSWWLHAVSPRKDDVHEICDAFNVHPLTIEDIVKQESREKIEVFPSYYFACFTSFNIVEGDEGREFEPFNLYVLVFRQGALSFSFEPNNHATRVQNKITILDDPTTISSDWICYALIDDIVDGFAPTIRQLEVETDSIEDQVFDMRDADSHKFLQVIGQARKDCMALLRILGSKPDVIRSFTKRCREDFRITSQMDISLYLEDVQDHAITMAHNLSHFENILNRAHRNYLATLSILEVSQGAGTNRTLVKVTLFASILLPLHLLSTMFGMNVINPFSNVDSVGSFFAIVGLMVAAGSIIWVVARLKRWL